MVGSGVPFSHQPFTTMPHLLLRKPFLGPLGLALALLTFSACQTTKDVAEGTADVAEEVGEAVADAAGATYNAVEDLFDDDDVEAAALLRPLDGSMAQGAITFEAEDGGVELEVSLSGLTPGEHGLHVHTNGSCDPPGSHFDPMGTNNHGGPDDDMNARHVGDLGNITVGADGTVEDEVQIDGIMLTGGQGLVGRAIVVHSGRDDMETDPSGDSGDPVACGVITGR